ncbi:MAG: serine acetyltransferase [Sphaerochaetaceae bacterium]|nr:serine acetyltransferase [Sphaerochaetaceae bacterium]
MNLNYKKYLDSFDRLNDNSANFIGLKPLPSSLCVEKCANELLELMFPGRCEGTAGQSFQDIITHQLHAVKWTLSNLIFLSFNNECDNACENAKISRKNTDKALELFFEELPTIRKKIKEDAQAGFDNDPAATNLHEVILSYPFIKAITIYRVAHCLFKAGVPILPRMLTEWAHKETGIDIHPGATIGHSFFIDHGTGVVIGETSVIGDNVIIYQGVTLGALSFPKDGNGKIIKGAKRHPTIEDNVTIYANATILGDIRIGANCIIGSSVWIKEDIPSSTRVLIQEPKTNHREIKKELQ